MELVVLAKEGFQTVAEHVASYRIGQSALRYLDRALWVVEKCARWAVPPPLDIDDQPQPELVRPLPWVFFLSLLITLRVTRESISIINLFMGKPPLRSADVVMYIQSKRRYLRTLKYQGNRMMRARNNGSATTPRTWHSRLQSLMDLTMCFRGSYGNNNTMRHSNNEEVLVVKRNKRGRSSQGPEPSTSETTMERLIEKMMVDLDADSDDSSYTLTNVTSVRSDRSDIADSDQDSSMQNDSNPPKFETLNQSSNALEISDSTENMDYQKNIFKDMEQVDDNPKSVENMSLPEPANNASSLIEESQTLLNAEKNSYVTRTSPNNKAKVANGQIENSDTRKELNNERRESEPDSENKLAETNM